MIKLTLVLGLIFASQCYGQYLEVGFYKGKCIFDVESIVRGVVQSKFISDRTIVAALLRLQFHDCFVHGCDASILLDGKNSEKTAIPNLSVRGYDIIDAAKSAVEFFCPGIVSCADIIAMATRDSVLLAKGGWYNVETGRRDGLISLAADVQLPSPSISISQSVSAFAQKRLDVSDMVYLLGGHTVGLAHCSLFQNRLYDFQNSGKPDPTMDTTLLNILRNKCPQNSDGSNTTFLDQNLSSSFIVDKSFYQQILQHKGILQVDQELALDPITSSAVQNIANGADFNFKFGQALVKLGRVDVLTGNEGQIRRFCRSVN
ncbi:peroxidase 60 [Euphorbia lathyris]|uniref:peroxidase 60 n=1 Tax=Euphorbia lathyris TaxID=212925 RepID=UPI003313881B